MKFNKLTLVATMILLTASIGCQRTGTDEELHARAVKFEQQGERNAAVIELKNALQQNPDNADARVLLGRIYLDERNAADAAKELNRALTLGVTDPVVRLDLFKSYILLRRYEDVKKHLNIGEYTESGNRSRAYALTASAYAGLGLYDRADSLYEESLSVQDNAEARVGLIDSALRIENTTHAATLVKEALLHYPASFELNLAAAYTEIQIGNYDAALTHVSKALEKHPDARAYLVKAELLLAQGQGDLAEVEVDKLLKSDSSNPMAKFVMGKIKYLQKDYDTAQNLLEQVLLVAPDFPPALLLLGSIYAKEEQNERALQYLKRHAAALPESKSGALLLSRVYLEQGQYAEAEEVLQPLLEAHPDDVSLLEVAASAMIRQGKIEQASGYLHKLAELQPNSSRINYYLGATLYAKGDMQAAAEVMEKVFAKDPDLVEARIILMKSYLEAEQYWKAQEVALQIRDANPELTIGWNYLGLVSQRQGEVPAAKKYYQSALKQDPYDPDANGQLATIARSEGALDQAQAYYDQIYKKYPSHFTTRVANAALYVQRKDNNAAIQQLEIATRSNPVDIRSNLLLATYYIRYGQYKDALRVSAELRQHYPTSTSMLAVLTESMLKLGQGKNALNVLSDWDTLQPQSAMVYALKAYANMQDQKYLKAQRMLDKAAALENNNLRTRLEQSRLYILQEEFSRAGLLLSKLQKELPKNSQVLARIGDLAFTRGDYNEAVALFRKASASGADSEMMGSLGKALWKSGKQEEMLTVWRSWLETFPRDRATRYLLSGAYRQMGEHTAANNELETILQQDEDAVVLNDLAWHLKSLDPDRARAYAERASELVPASPQIKDTLGVILMLQGHHDQSTFLLREAAKAAPDDPDIQFHFAQALAVSGLKKEAEAVLTRLLDSALKFQEHEEAVTLLSSLKGM